MKKIVLAVILVVIVIVTLACEVDVKSSIYSPSLNYINDIPEYENNIFSGGLSGGHGATRDW